MALFIVIAKDGTDEDAPARRQAARAQHLALSDAALQRGEQLFGGALLTAQHTMCGSVMLVAFEDRAGVDAWLAKEPYVTGKVWQQVEVFPFQVGPSFLQQLRGLPS